MKRLLVLASLLFFVFSLSGQTVIPLELANGVYRLPCRVNGYEIKLILDTGASSICISEDFADFLYGKGLLTRDDIKGEGRAQLADGRVIMTMVVNLRDVEISGIHLYNVEAYVVEGQNACFLLGQTALQKLGPYTISGNRLIISKSDQPEKDGTVNALRLKAKACLDASNYIGAIAPLEELRAYSHINPHEMAKLVQAYAKAGQYEKCYLAFRDWNSGMSVKTSWEDRSDTYLTVAEISMDHKEDYSVSVMALSLATDALNESHLPEKELAKREAKIYAMMARCYLYLDQRMNAAEAYTNAVFFRMTGLGIDFLDIYQEKKKDRDLAEYCYQASLLYPVSSDEFVVFLCSALRLGDRRAAAVLEEYDPNDRYMRRYLEWIDQRASRAGGKGLRSF